MDKRRIYKKDIATAELEKLEQQFGYLTPGMVLDSARPEKSPLHSFFNWDDKKAAEKYRLEQARSLVASVRVEFRGQEVDQYWSAQVTMEDQTIHRAYYTTQSVLSNEELYQSVLSDAIKQLRYWQEKYQEIVELKGVVNSRKLDDIELTIATK